MNMINLKYFPILVVLFSILTVRNTFAVDTSSQDIFLATISTDYVKKSYDLILTVNDRKLISAIKTKNNNKQKFKTYLVNVLNKPITLVKAVGITLVNLSCLKFATNRGCDIIIEYPENITIGKFRKFTAKLEKHRGVWKLTKDGRPFSKMVLISKKLLGILIGIKRIEIQ